MRWCRCRCRPAPHVTSRAVSSITLTDSDARHVHLSMPALSLTVIVVGGGYGGCVLAPKLEKAGFDVILIEPPMLLPQDRAAVRRRSRQAMRPKSLYLYPN